MNQESRKVWIETVSRIRIPTKSWGLSKPRWSSHLKNRSFQYNHRRTSWAIIKLAQVCIKSQSLSKQKRNKIEFWKVRASKLLRTARTLRTTHLLKMTSKKSRIWHRTTTLRFKEWKSIQAGQVQQAIPTTHFQPTRHRRHPCALAKIAKSWPVTWQTSNSQEDKPPTQTSQTPKKLRALKRLILSTKTSNSRVSSRWTNRSR